MRYKILLPLLFVACISVPACTLLDTVTNSSGEEVTKLEAVLDSTKEGIDAGAPIVNTFAPGVGTIAGGVGLLLSLIGSTATSIVMAKRRGNALQAVIKGVEIVNSQATKDAIKEVAGNLGVEPYINKVVKKQFPA